ncbi:hypothetical protein IWGMT90018_24480 [Mycobacterium kiyosense]|nr:hypothetical protein IWGMT90018_24480 [Mycobacterium kiyosense]
MSVRLAEVIGVLDEAYPPRLAESWDSVGLVCGDPDDVIESVTIAVDATPAVVDEVPDRSLLLAHHPLLLRGVDTVAASTPKGALIHRLIRSGRALFTAHTNADSAAPGVSDALADALGLAVEAVLDRSPAASELDKWVIYVPQPNADAVREAVFAAGAGHIGDYSHCSWSVTGIGQFLALDGANPAIGSVGTVERVTEDRVEVVAPARAREAVLAAMRRAHPTRSPPSTSSPWRRCPPAPGWAASARCANPNRCATSSRASMPRCRAHRGGARRRRPGPAGGAGGGVRGSGRLVPGRGRRRRRAGLRHLRPAAPPRRRASPGLRGGAGRRGTLGQRIPVVRSGGWRAENAVRWIAAGAGIHPAHRSVESGHGTPVLSERPGDH